MNAAANDPNRQPLPPDPAPNGAANGRHEATRDRALRRAVKRAADAAMRCHDAAAAANEALATLRAEFVFRFDLLRSRQRQPALIDPAPLPPPTPPEGDTRV